LPNSSFVMAAAMRGGRDDLLRQLNVTARYKDKPPIMFRLAFAPAPEEPAPIAAESAPAVVAAPPAAPPTAGPPSAPMVPTNPPTTVPAAAKSPAPAAVAPVATVAVPETGKAATATPAPAPVSASTAKPAAHDNLGLHNLDREEAKLAPPTALPAPLAPPSAKREIKSALAPSPPLLASAAAPTPGSMEALVWKPSVFEALPDAEPEDKTYDVVDYTRLGSLVGRYVELVTYGDKKIGGYIVGYDDSGVTIRIERLGGNVTFVVAKARVRQVQLPRQ
jgi:hypothetical protein